MIRIYMGCRRILIFLVILKVQSLILIQESLPEMCTSSLVPFQRCFELGLHRRIGPTLGAIIGLKPSPLAQDPRCHPGLASTCKIFHVILSILDLFIQSANFFRFIPVLHRFTLQTF